MIEYVHRSIHCTMINLHKARKDKMDLDYHITDGDFVPRQFWNQA